MSYSGTIKRAALLDGKIMIGNVNNIPIAIEPSGDMVMSNAGVFTRRRLATGSGGGVYLGGGSLTGGTITIDGRVYSFTNPGGGDVALGAASEGDPALDALAICAGINGDTSAVVIASVMAAGSPATPFVLLASKTMGVATNYTVTVTTVGGGPLASFGTMSGGADATNEQMIVMSRAMNDGEAAQGCMAFSTPFTTITNVLVVRQKEMVPSVGGALIGDNDDRVLVTDHVVFIKQGGDAWVVDDTITIIVTGS